MEIVSQNSLIHDLLSWGLPHLDLIPQGIISQSEYSRGSCFWSILEETLSPPGGQNDFV